MNILIRDMGKTILTAFVVLISILLLLATIPSLSGVEKDALRYSVGAQEQEVTTTEAE